MADQTTTIPKRWTTEELGKSCLKIGSGATPRGGADSYKEHGISLIRSQNVHDFKFAYSGLAFIDQNQADELSNVEVFEDDILINITGDSVARVCRVPRNVLPARVNQHVSIIRTNENRLHHGYAYYYLLNPPFKNYLLGLANTGATRNALTKGMLENLLINAPAVLAEQRSIAAVLSSLDDKIELLREQNKTLEATAQAIFKDWFVKFNFPGATGNLIDSELGDIPQGWRVEKLSEIIEFEGGAQPPKSEHIYEPRQGYIRFVQNRDYSNSTHITYIKESKKNKICETLDILMDKYGEVGVPRYGIAGAYNVALAKIVPKIKNTREYLRSYFSQPSIFNLLSASAQASTRGSLNASTFKGLQIVIPEKGVLMIYEKMQSLILNKILFNKNQVQTLSKLRDTLLPKLMKGEIRVKGFEN